VYRLLKGIEANANWCVNICVCKYIGNILLKTKAFWLNACESTCDNIPDNNEQINVFVVLSSLELYSQREYNLKHN